MLISSTKEAGDLVRSLREERRLTRRELSERSGIPLRTVYAVEGGELNNLSLDRLSALLAPLGASLCVRVDRDAAVPDSETNALVDRAAHGTAGADDPWGIWP